MKKFIYSLLSMLVLIACADSTVTPPTSDIGGTWPGTGMRGDTSQTFTITMTVIENGPTISATATFSGALQVDNVVLTGTRNGTAISLSGAGGNVQLNGVVSGSTISGNGSALLQSGTVLPFSFTLTRSGGTPNPNPGPTQPDDGTCTTVWSENITVPTTLSDTPKLCDYLLEGYVNVSSKLIIEPGVVIRAKQDAIIWVDGGEFLAVGNAQNRITLEGLNHISGYWKGIRFAEARESRIEYVDLKDAGQVCTGLWCTNGALILDDVTVSLTNSTVSNSYVHGLNATGDVLFSKFENNRFYGNTWAGAFVDAKYIPVLDTASDYLGEEANNGTPYVLLGSGDLDDGETRTWKNLNAPYLIGGYLNIEGGIVIVEPGTTVVFGEEDWLHVEGNGELRAIGTPEARITFKGEVEKPGYWDGITFWDSNWEENELSYVDIKHSGNVSGLLDAYGGVRMKYTSSLKINNSSFSDNAQYAVACDEPDQFDTVTLTLGPGNSFSNNAAGDIDPDCGVAP